MKNFLSVFCILVLASAYSQTPPTLVSWEVDTMCNSSFSHEVVHTIAVYDPDGDYTTMTIDSYNPGHFISVSVDMPPFMAGETTRYFTITASPSTGLSPGLNLSNMNITMTGNISNDLTSTSDVITNVPIYGALILNFDVSGLTMCANDQPIDLRDYATPAGGTFFWAGQTSYMFDPEVYINEGGTELNYDYKNPAGCYAYLQSFAPTLNPAPALFTSPVNATCGNADGSISSSISGGVAPYNLYWSTGNSEIISGGIPADLLNLPAGNYYGNLTDVNGCKAVAIAQISDAEITVIENITLESCMLTSADGAIDLIISGSGGTPDLFFWSNGESTEDATGLTKGSYSVMIHTDLGCEYYNTYAVGHLPDFTIENVNSTPATCSGADAVIDYDVTVGGSTYSYLWNNGATTEDIFGAAPGYYECVVTDIVTGCTKTYGHQVIAVNGPNGNITDITKTQCNLNEGDVDMNVYPTMNPIATYSWNSGQTTEDLENVAAGTYELTVTDIGGCIFKTTVTVGTIQPERPEICMLTVDSAFTYNMIVWEKDLSQPNIAGYNIYRELSTYGDFELVAYRPYALESFFEDNAASPIDRSWRYRISAIDECGVESPASDIHKTIHVVANTVNATDYTISWDNYEGFAYSSVDIFRFDSTNGWQTIANIPFGSNTYLDVPPIFTGLDYMVEFNLSFTCTSTKAQDHNSTRSNKTASVFSGGGSTVQIKDEDLGVISIYPNPASSAFTIHVDQPDQVQYFEITDINGNLILTGSINTNNTTVESAEMAAGIYLIKIYSLNNIVTQKLIVN